MKKEASVKHTMFEYFLRVTLIEQSISLSILEFKWKDKLRYLSMYSKVYFTMVNIKIV